MRYGYWLPVFGGWLRNVPDEAMETSWAYAKRLGIDIVLVATRKMVDVDGRPLR